MAFAGVRGDELVGLFPVEVAGEFVTLRAPLAVVLDAGGRIASARAMEDLRDPFADLGERDGWRPFFFPVAIP